ncbi:MAG: prepilin-type N-terminal cleavage/methylation domain-containing protein [Pseudomonadales bacterium]
MKKGEGFTLVELVVVILLVSILAVSALSRYSNQNTFSLKTEQEQLIAALFQAQQLAMSGRSTQFVILSSNSFTVRDPGIPGAPGDAYNIASITYPQNLSSGVTFNPSALIQSYNSLGETTPATIILAAGSDSVNVCLETSGYAHGC